MANPKADIAVELAKALREALSERVTADLSAEGVQSLSRVAPADRVQMDSMLEQGYSLGEVGGTGVDTLSYDYREPGNIYEKPADGLIRRQEARPYQLNYAQTPEGNPHFREFLAADPLDGHESRRKYNRQINKWLEKTADSSTIPAEVRYPGMSDLISQRDQPIVDFSTTPYYDPPPDPDGSYPWGPASVSGPWRSAEQQAIEAARKDPNYISDTRDPEFAQDQFAIDDASTRMSRMAYTDYASKPADWPQPWKDWENIPAVAGTVAAGAAVLGAGSAQAAAPIMVDDGAEDVLEIDDGAEDVVEPQLAATAPQLNVLPQPGMSDLMSPIEVPPAPSLMPNQSVGQPQAASAAIPTQTAARQRGGVDNTQEVMDFFKTAFMPVETVKESAILPLVKLVQDFNRTTYFGGEDPNAPLYGRKPQPVGGIGGALREASPTTAFLAENVAGLPLGQTDLTAPGSEAALPAINKLEQTFGRNGGAFVHAFASGMSDLPFYLIPGAGQGFIAQGATGGFLSALADPKQTVMEGTLGGAAGGAILKPIAKVGGKLADAVSPYLTKNIDAGKWAAKYGAKAQPDELLPIAILPPGKEAELAEKIMAMPEPPPVVEAPPQQIVGDQSPLPQQGSAEVVIAGGADPDADFRAVVDLYESDPSRFKPSVPWVKKQLGLDNERTGRALQRAVQEDVLKLPEGTQREISRAIVQKAKQRKAKAAEAAPAAEPVEKGTGGASPGAARRAAARQNVIAVAVDVQNGEVVKKALIAGPNGPEAGKAPADFDGKHVLTENAKSAMRDDPGNIKYADIFKLKSFRLSREELALMEVAPDAPLMKGGVIVLEGHGGTGTARLYDVDDLKLQRRILRQRNIVEYTTPEGQKVLGYHEPGGTRIEQPDGTFIDGPDVFLPPEAAEQIPGAATTGYAIDQAAAQRMRELSTQEIDALLEKRMQMQELQKELDDLKAAHAKAVEADLALGGDGSGSALPPNTPHQPAVVPPVIPKPGQGPVPTGAQPPAAPPGQPPGGGAPPPPPPPQMPPIPQPHNMTPLEELRVKWALSARWIRNRSFSPTTWGPQAQVDAAMQSFSIQSFERLRDDTFTMLQKSTPGLSKLSMADQRAVFADLTKVQLGQMTPAQLLANPRNAPVVQEAYNAIRRYKDQILRNEQEIRALKMLPPESLIRKRLQIPDDEDLPGWAVQMYYRFLLKNGEWATLVRRDQAKKQRIMQGIWNDVIHDPANKAKFGKLTPDEQLAKAQEYFDVLIGDPDAIERLRSANVKPGDFLAGARSSLKARKQLSPWEKEALGEVENTFIRVAESITRQEQLILQGRMWKSIAENPSLSSFADDPMAQAALGHTKPLPADSSKFGLAAGKYVSPETYYALHEAPRLQRNARNAVNRTVNAVKYMQTVGNLASWETNFLGNAQGAMLSNLVNPFASPGEIGHGFYRFASDIKAFRASPGIRDNPQTQRFMRAIELGIIGSEFSTAEFRASASSFALAVSRGTAGRKVGIPDYLSVLANVARKAKDNLAGAYSAIDSGWKYATYISGLRKGGIRMDGSVDVAKATKFIGSRMRPGMLIPDIIEQVELEVARRIHDGFPMLDRVGEYVAKAGQYAGVVVNPYLKVKTELMRNYATAAKRSLPERLGGEKGMAANMLGYGLVVGTIAALTVKRRESNGIMQKEVDAAWAKAPPAFKRFKSAGSFAWTERQDDGQILAVDMTQLFEPLTWLQGDPESGALTNMFVNATILGVDGTPAEGLIREQMARAGLIPPEWEDKMTPEYQRSGAKAFVDAAAKYGPGTFRNYYNMAAKNPRLGMFEPQGGRLPGLPGMSPGTGAANMLLGPGRVTPLSSPEQDLRNTMGQRWDVRGARQDLRNAATLNEGQSTGPGTGGLDKEKAMQDAERVMLEKVRRLEQSTK